MPFQMSYGPYPESFWVIRYDGANRPAKVGTIIFMGYPDDLTFDMTPDMEPVGMHSYVINDPDEFDITFGKAAVIDVFNAYLEELQLAALAADSFFSTAVVIAYNQPLVFQVGPSGASRVLIAWSDNITLSGGTYHAGVTINVNGLPATISSSSGSGSATGHYDLASPIPAGAVVTWEYDAATGYLLGRSGNQVQSFGAEAVTNTIGGYWVFSRPENSGQVLLAL